MDEQTDNGRRSFLGFSSGEAALTAISAVAASVAAPAAANAADSGLRADNETDIDILNFTLNLEYLESEYYLRGVLGRTLDEVFGSTLGGPVRGGRKVQFTTAARDGMLRNIAGNEVQHVRFVRELNGSRAVARPAIDFEAGFAAVASAAGMPDFDPFANEMNFFLGAMLFEDVGITVIKDSAKRIRNYDILESSAGLLASEGYHMGAVRSVIYKMGEPARSRSGALSDLRDRLDGPQDLDQPVVKTGEMSNFVPSNENGIAFGRTPNHVLNILYNNPAAGVLQGGFFPEGVNGRMRSS
jgi:hypothetical protein